MTIYLSQILNGLGIGLIYFLLSVGMSIIFGLLDFVNFAHGAFYLLGGYFCYQLIAVSGNFWLSLLTVPFVVAGLVWLLEKVCLKYAYKLSHNAQIMLTFGISLVIQELVIIQWGTIGKAVPVPESLKGTIEIAGFVYPHYRLFVILFSALIAIALWLILERSSFGAIVRAGSESTEMVSLLGIDIYKVFSLTFALSAFSAGIAGVLAAPLRGVEPFMGSDALTLAFVVVTIGGMASFTGALAGGIVIGIVQSVMSSLWPEGAQLMIYGVMALVMLLRPNGLLGRA